MRVSVIIPVFNEVSSIGVVLERVSAVSLPIGVSREIIVVDDGSTDGSKEFLQGVSEQTTTGTILVSLPRNVGKGRAIRAGLAKASGDVVIIQDADLEYDPAQHPQILAPLLAGRALAVYGSRFLGSISGMRFENRLANYILSFTASVLFGAKVTDEATGLKAFRAEVLRSIGLQCERFEFCPEVTAKLLRQGISIAEVPIRYEGRSTAQGKKIRWWDGFHALFTLLRYRLFQ